MASTIMHLCIAKRVNEALLLDEQVLLLGAIAPDMNKFVNLKRNDSHFTEYILGEETVNITKFLNKYHDQISNPFEMGYLIHLLTDKYWLKNIIYKKFTPTNIKKLEDSIEKDIYDNYSSLNIPLIKKYGIDLNVFNNIKLPDTKIKEIPINKLPIFIEKIGLFITESKQNKTRIFSFLEIDKFIFECSKQIIKDLQKINSKYRGDIFDKTDF